MKKVIIVLIAILGIAVLIAMMSSNSQEPASSNTGSVSQRISGQMEPRVPAHYKDANSARPLNATLDPEQFFGKTKRAYEIAREIPETLAQLPCYCYCDQGFGHKSLHSCYESDHSAHCATCVDEALLAYQLQKEEKLSSVEIREAIIKRFSR